jgi:hypothetical protein
LIALTWLAIVAATVHDMERRREIRIIGALAIMIWTLQDPKMGVKHTLGTMIRSVDSSLNDHRRVYQRRMKVWFLFRIGVWEVFFFSFIYSFFLEV